MVRVRVSFVARVRISLWTGSVLWPVSEVGLG